jgi:hypothetical protein
VSNPRRFRDSNRAIHGILPDPRRYAVLAEHLGNPDAIPKAGVVGVQRARLSPDDVSHVVENHVRRLVEQHQILPDDPVFNSSRKRRQREQEGGRSGGERSAGRTVR